MECNGCLFVGPVHTHGYGCVRVHLLHYSMESRSQLDIHGEEGSPSTASGKAKYNASKVIDYQHRRHDFIVVVGGYCTVPTGSNWEVNKRYG